MTDREVGEFLLRELFHMLEVPSLHGSITDSWHWTGRIIEAMRERGWKISAVDSHDDDPWGWVRFDNHGVEREFACAKVEPRTVALAAAKALGMEVSDDGK